MNRRDHELSVDRVFGAHTVIGWVRTSRRTTGSPAEEDRHRILCDSPATLLFNRS